MYVVSRKIVLLSVFTLSIFSGVMLEATIHFWRGTTSDLNDPANWTFGYPVAGDKANFWLATSYTPQAEPSSTFTAQQIHFPSGAPSYVINMTSPGSIFNMHGTTVGLPTGVLSESTALQTFNINNGGTVNLYDTGNAWISGNAGSIKYYVGDPLVSDPGFMNFNDSSSAGEAPIYIANSSFLIFKDSSNAGYSTILSGEDAHGTSGFLQFLNDSGASNSEISLTNHSWCVFGNQSSAQSSTLDVGSSSPQTVSELSFYHSSTAGNATINVTGGSVASGTGSDASSLVFFDVADAGTSEITLGENVHGTFGFLDFKGSSSAAASTITVLQDSHVNFDDTSDAGSSNIRLGDLNASGYCYFSGNASGKSCRIYGVNNSEVFFQDGSNAGSSEIIMSGGMCVFQNFMTDHSIATSGAGSASISAFDNAQIVFTGQTSAESATILVGGFFAPTPGTLSFYNNATAGTSFVYVVEGSVINFFQNSQAGNSSIILGKNIFGFSEPTANLNFKDNSSAASCAVSAYENTSIVFSGEATADKSSIFLGDTSNVTFESNSSTSSTSIVTESGASINLEQTGSDIFTGVISGTGSIYKTGSGSFNFLSDSSAFAGTTTITNGTFALNGVLGGAVFTQNSGVLSGIGTVLGDLIVTNKGKIAPGNSIGTININGNYNQSDAIYQVQVDSNGDASLINVGGVATLESNAGVNVIPLSIPTGEVFTVPILHADGGLFGTFSSLTTANPLLSLALLYDPNNAYLTYENALTANALTYNEQQVANQLITITDPTADELVVLTALATLPADQQTQALAQISAEQYTTLLFSSEEVTRSFIRRLYDPLRPLITGALCGCSCGIDTWITGSWERGTYGGDTNASGFKRTGYEFSMGVQTCFHPQWVVGVAATYERDSLDYNVGGESVNNTGLGAIYALYRPHGFYALADLVIGGGRQNVRRPIDLGVIAERKHATPTTFQTALYVESGFDCWINCMLFQPFLGVEGGYYSRNKFTENGSSSFLSMSVNEKRYGTVNSRLGCHFSSESYSCVSLAIDVAWQFRMIPLNHAINENFITFGDTFKIKGIPLGRNSVDGAVNLSYKIDNSWMIYAEAIGQRWKKDSSYSIIGGIGYTW